MGISADGQRQISVKIWKIDRQRGEKFEDKEESDESEQGEEERKNGRAREPYRGSGDRQGLKEYYLRKNIRKRDAKKGIQSKKKNYKSSFFSIQ